ncbi:hypothetical protein ACHHYP_01461 [Achlya hypogyna]|uniref:Impact N-terminal domain-containing protein n=1 Tax=Achlya hypogyna TaxID=1202772 RepID=A0A1V9Z8I3_ACHHY|nr:hypothetical protein ACHHYP_01461 [Achlya hypogyna]
MKFLSIARAVEAEVPKIKGSRFIGFASPVTSRQEALAVVATRRTLFPQANHHCFAYTLPGEAFASDDGEPHNTAGRPILQALTQHDVLNVCLVVSRIFGGTKLGTGGLVRAYGSAAKYVMEAAVIEESCTKHHITIIVPMASIAAVKKALHRYEGVVNSLTIEDSMAVFDTSLPVAHAAALESMLSETTNGRAVLMPIGEVDTNVR